MASVNGIAIQEQVVYSLTICQEKCVKFPLKQPLEQNLSLVELETPQVYHFRPHCQGASNSGTLSDARFNNPINQYEGNIPVANVSDMMDTSTLEFGQRRDGLCDVDPEKQSSNLI